MPPGGGGAVSLSAIITYLFCPTTSAPAAQRTALVLDGRGLDSDRLLPSDVVVPLMVAVSLRPVLS